jgi:hypothetical protein
MCVGDWVIGNTKIRIIDGNGMTGSENHQRVGDIAILNISF